MFRKKLDIEVLNLFNTIENKIDTINSNFGCVTFLDGCCQCKQRDIKINEMLITFLESKFSEFYEKQICTLDIDSILTSIKTELQNTLTDTVDHKSSFETLTETISNLTNEIHQLKQASLNQVSLNQASFKETNDKFQNKLDMLINKTDAMFYDNEIIKHHFLIEENIRFYCDTIDSLKVSIDKSINDIDNVLVKFNI